MSTILLLLDAFRHDYLSEKTTPFLWRCAQEGEYYAGVEQSMGFCERSEILTGLRGDESGFFTAIGFDPPNSPYANLSCTQFLNITELTALFFSSIFSKNFSARVQEKLRYIISGQLRKRGIKMSPYFIPYSWIHLFALTEDRIDHRDPTAFKTPSIFTLLNTAGRTYCYDSFTALNFQSPYQSDEERLNAVIRNIKKSHKDLYLVYIAAADVYGHAYGPASLEFRHVLIDLDGHLEHFVKTIESFAPGNRYIFLGDHGMATVTNRIDAEKEIIRLLCLTELRKGHDVVYFLDSTMVRLWVMNDKARKRLPHALASSKLFNENGLWMGHALANRCHVPWPDRHYGDYLWVANSGNLVFPDFFHRRLPCKGMHGYDPHLPESHGMCINWGKGVPMNQHTIMPLTKAFNILKENLKL